MTKTWQRLLAWDERVLLVLSQKRRPLFTHTLRVATHLGSGKSWTLLGVVLMFVGTYTTDLMAYRLAFAAGGGALVGQVLKRLLRRPRPNSRIHGFEAVVHNPDAFSFPSGHTLAAVAMAVAWSGISPGLGALMGAFAGLVALSRVYLGAHYPLDVAAGGFLGVLVGALARFIVPG